MVAKQNERSWDFDPRSAHCLNDHFLNQNAFPRALKPRSQACLHSDTGLWDTPSSFVVCQFAGVPVVSICLKMGKLTLFEIRFPNPVYQAGQQINGKVVMHLAEPMKMRSK